MESGKKEEHEKRNQVNKGKWKSQKYKAERKMKERKNEMTGVKTGGKERMGRKEKVKEKLHIKEMRRQQSLMERG